MEKNKCPSCDGTGWTSAAKEAGMENAPLMFQPIGVFPCRCCGGSGDFGLPADLEEQLKEIIQELDDIQEGLAGVNLEGKQQ